MVSKITVLRVKSNVLRVNLSVLRVKSIGLRVKPNVLRVNENTTIRLSVLRVKRCHIYKRNLKFMAKKIIYQCLTRKTVVFMRKTIDFTRKTIH